jgi:hypothetical protein
MSGTGFPIGVSPTRQTGRRPDRLVEGPTADGGVDVTQVIAAIDWVSLSFGTNTTQASGVDPRAYAVEQAWKNGIVVVAADGNAGYQKGAGAACLADPAYDPYAIAVAGSDTTQSFTNSTGTGSIDASRGTDRPSMNGVVLSGETDIFGKPINTTTLATAEATGASWSGGTWNSSTWSGSSWSGSSWSGASWSGSSWSGNS